MLLLVSLAGVAEAVSNGLLVGLKACNKTDPMQQWQMSAAPFPLRLAGVASCAAVTKADCDGFCLVTAPCAGSLPLWALLHGPGKQVTFQVVGGQANVNRSCLDFEDKVKLKPPDPDCYSM